MAEDVIISALIKAGIKIDPADEKSLRTKLAGIGEALGEGGLDALEAQSRKLIALRSKLKKDDQALLASAARSKDGGAGLTGELRKQTIEAASRLQTYQTQLKKVVGTLDTLGVRTKLPIFQEIAQLNQAFQQLGDTLRNLGPLLSPITQERKAAALADRKAQAARTKAARIEAQRIGVESARILRGEANPRGKAQYIKGVKSQFLNVADSKEAQKVVEYAKVQAEASKAVLAQIEKEHGVTSKLAEKPRREAMLAAQAVAAANQRVEALKSSEAEDKRNRSAAATLRAAEEKIAINRTTRANRERAGASAFVQAGGINGSVGNYTDLTKSQQALKFVNGELSDSAAHLKALTTAYGANHPRVLAAAAENKKLAAYYHDLAQQIDAVTAAKKKQDATTRAETAQRNQEHKEAIALNKSLDAAAAKDKRTRDQLDRRNPTGKDALLAAGGVGSSFTNLDHLGKAKALRSYLDAQLKNTNRLQEVYSKTLGENSQQSQAATAQANRYADALARVDAQLEVLKSKRALSSRQAGKSGAFTEGRKIYESVRNTPDGLANLEGADKGAARSYLSARKTESLSRYQQLATDFGANSRQAKAAAAAVQQYDTALAQMNRTVGVSHASIGGLATVFKTFLKYAVLYQALYGVINAMRALVTSITDLQAEMLEIQAVTASTDSQMQQLGATVQSVAQGSKFSLKELTEASKVLAQAGIPISELNGALQATADFAAATGTNLQTAADLLSTTRSVFKGLSDATLSNQLAKAINISKLTGEDLKTILSLGAQTAASFNLTSEQFLSAVATLRNAGLKSSTAATGLRQGMLEIFTPDRTLVKALRARYRELGEEIGNEAIRSRFFEFSKTDSPLVSALTELKRLGFNDEGQIGLSRAFDVRSTNAIKAMIANLQELSANEGRVTFGRAAAEGAAITVEGLNASLTRLNSTITGFTYNRAEGLLGWLADVTQATTEAIENYSSLRKVHDAHSGLSGAERESSPFQPPAEDLSFYQRYVVQAGAAVSEFMLGGGLAGVAIDYRPGKENRDLEARIKGGGDIGTEQRLKSEALEVVANSYDIGLAEQGKAKGTGAEHIVKTIQAAENLRAMVENTFGPEMVVQEGALRELLDSYTSLTGSQRELRQNELSALTGLGKEELDGSLFEMHRLRESVDGTLEAIREDIAGRLIAARERIEALEGEAPEKPEDIEAAALLDLYRTSDKVRQIVNGTTQDIALAQIENVAEFSQALAEEVRNKGKKQTPGVQARQHTQLLNDQAKLLANKGDIDSAIPTIKAAVSELLTAYTDTTESNLSYLKTLKGVLNEAALKAEGDAQLLLANAVNEVDAIAKAKEASIIKETAERVRKAPGVRDALSSPGFAEYAQNLPDSSPVKSTLLQNLNKEVPDSEFIQNTQLSKTLIKFTETWRESVDEYQQIQKRVSERLGADLKNEAKAGAFEERATEARNLNQFDNARSNTVGATEERLQLIERQLKDADEDIKFNISRDQPHLNQALEERVVTLKHEKNQLLTKQSGALSQLDQEEAKLNNRRATDAAKIEQARLGGLLGAAGFNTPKNVLDETLRLYNENNEELKRLAAEKKILDGDLSQASREQQYEEDQKLVKYQEQNAYLELVFRQERERRDEIQRQLDVPFTSGDPTEDARLRGLGVEPGTRTKRVAYDTNRAQLVAEQIDNAKFNLGEQKKTYAEVDARLKANPGAIENANLVIDQKTREGRINELTKQIQDDTVLLGEISQNLVQMHASIFTSVGAGFDIDTLIMGLQQAESGVESLAAKIHDDLIAGLEGVGDAFADSLLEGENFFDTLNDLLIDTGKSVLRDIIKTYTTESIVGLLGTISPSFTAEAAGPGAIPSAVGSGGLLSTLGGIIKDGYNYVTGNTPAEAAVAPAVAGVTGEASPFSLVGDLLGGTTDEAGGMCCVGAGEVSPDGLTDLAAKGLGYEPDEAGLGGVLQEATNPTSPVLAEAASEEAGGFFDFLKSGFDSIWGALSDGFGSAMKGIGDILFGSGGSGGGAGAFGMLATVMGFKHGGLIKAATGGVISGRGTGMSDSIPGFIRSKSGKLRPLLTSNGESILNAKATSFLGENGIHALNSGDFMRANTAGMKGDIRAMMGSIRPGNLASPGTPTGNVVKNYKSTQVAVTPSQMRMRMGDWLEQHVIEELGKR